MDKTSKYEYNKNNAADAKKRAVFEYCYAQNKVELK